MGQKKKKVYPKNDIIAQQTEQVEAIYQATKNEVTEKKDYKKDLKISLLNAQYKQTIIEGTANKAIILELNGNIVGEIKLDKNGKAITTIGGFNNARYKD